jgi:hypothetical protein
MGVDPFIGSEAVASGRLTPYQLRSRFHAVYPGVHLPKDAELTARTRATAARLWTRSRGVLAGHSAAALHGAKWVDAHQPAELLYDNRPAPRSTSRAGGPSTRPSRRSMRSPVPHI